MKLYISEGAVWLLIVVYLPLSMGGLWLLWRSLPERLPVRIAGVVVGGFLAAAIPLWDVVITSAKMAELCPQAGVKIYRTVSADGFYTNFGGSDDIKRGFNYVEAKSGIRVEIYTKVENEIQKRVIDTEKAPYVPRSRYEFIYAEQQGAFEGRRDIGIQTSVILDREKNEELGRAVRYKAYPGWVDRNTIAQFGQLLWMCPERDQDPDMKLMRQVIVPNK